MGYKVDMQNKERFIKENIEFKEIVFWKVAKFMQESLPDKRPVKINIEYG